MKRPFFQFSHESPYHISVGAVLVDEEGKIACHYFAEKVENEDIYILMRESVEDGESILTTLTRGLLEEFGAKADPIAFLGSLVGRVPSENLVFEKTTLYLLCFLRKWDINLRFPNDPESDSTIEWLSPEELIFRMRAQRKYGRIDLDESEIIERAQEYLQKNSSCCEPFL
ncbi:MAG: NUDIX hydrolase [Chlamydiota bacterium]